jgi:hypothetical protein
MDELIKCSYCLHYVHKGNYCEQCGHKLSPNKKPADNGKLNAEELLQMIEQKILQQSFNDELSDIF